MEQAKKASVPERLLSIGLWIVFAGYAFVLIKIILLKYGLGAELRDLNPVPFRFVYDLLFPAASLDVSLKNVLGNFAIFIPFGILAPALFRRIDTLKKAVLAGFCVSLLFEVLQAVFGLGTTDVDDLILNTLGSLCGGALYFFVFGKFRAEWKTRLATLLFLCAFGACGLLALWLYAPGELPRVIEQENIEVLNGLDTASYTVSCTLESIDETGLACARALLRSGGETGKTRYEFADGANIYVQTLSAQYSPNGNIQKTICSFDAADIPAAQALVSEREHVFADIWLDEAGLCETLLLTVYDDE